MSAIARLGLLDLTGQIVNSYTANMSGAYFQILLRDTRALMISSGKFMQLLNTSTFGLVSSGVIQSPKYIKNGDFVNETHFVLSTGNGYIVMVKNNGSIKWSQIHNYYTFETLEIACISNLIYFMAANTSQMTIGAVNLEGDLQFVKIVDSDFTTPNYAFQKIMSYNGVSFINIGEHSTQIISINSTYDIVIAKKVSTEKEF